MSTGTALDHCEICSNELQINFHLTPPLLQTHLCLFTCAVVGSVQSCCTNFSHYPLLTHSFPTTYQQITSSNGTSREQVTTTPLTFPGVDMSSLLKTAVFNQLFYHSLHYPWPTSSLQITARLELRENEASNLSLFTCVGVDSLQSGSTKLRSGAIVGLPASFSFTEAEDVMQSPLLVGQGSLATSKFPFQCS